MFETVSAPPHTLIPKKHGRKAAAGGAHSPLEGAQFLFREDFSCSSELFLSSINPAPSSANFYIYKI
jgi:hypothetical protein